MTALSTPPHAYGEPLLDREARSQLTTSLLQQALHAGAEERQELHSRVVVLHLDVAESVAWRYRGRGQDHEDLVQVARLGLVEAVERFDPDRGPFLAFAVPTMLGHVKRHFRDHSWMVRPPRPIQERRQDIVQARDDLTHTLGRPATTAELARHLDLTDEEVREASNVQGCFQAASLDARYGDDGSESGYSHVDVLGEEQAELGNIDTLATISPACLLLDAADRQLLYLRFYLQCTQDEIGARLGISQMQVSRRLRRILTRLRRTIGDLEAPAETGARLSVRQPDAAVATPPAPAPMPPAPLTTETMAA